jgi:hypothetical protein
MMQLRALRELTISVIASETSVVFLTGAKAHLPKLLSALTAATNVRPHANG